MLRRHRNAHRRIWLTLLVAMPLLFIGLMAMRPRDLADRAPERLAPADAAR
jgi:hypothetical protein